MKIENMRSIKMGSRARIEATIIWEDCNRPIQEVFIETDEEYADDLSCDPHAFLLGCVIPAMHYGEKRVFMDAEICPELRDGLHTAMSWIHHWYYEPGRELVRIEAKTRSTMSTLRTPERAACFFSGGIDAYATLRSNRINFPLEHPWSIKDGFLVYGFEIDKAEPFYHVHQSLTEAAKACGITLIPVYTNLYLAYREEDTRNKFSFWGDKFQGAAFSAVAHAFARRLTVVSLASSCDIPNLYPMGSHPLLEPNYSSSELRIRHDGITLSRLAKTKLVADWDVALQQLRVCNLIDHYKAGVLNCGECPKCVMTMLALLALDKLDKTTAFPRKDLSGDLVLRKGTIGEQYSESCYRELIAPLAEIGRHDLVEAIRGKIAEYHNQQKIPQWRARAKQYDSKYLKGSISRLKRLIS